ncbi:hypothetical protein Salat_0693100 [Sesamum alatum]|uniref:Uncharacterized protein n=1 Tax=Sesamum alatum TaxID=300844 RepID=A0AAE1YSD1_9LAMI|nr:hypothetical protein Salat_0693100 [Sesamum alatum]
MDSSSLRPTVVRPFRSAHSSEVSSSDMGGSRRPARGVNIFVSGKQGTAHNSVSESELPVFSGPNGHSTILKALLNPLAGGPSLPVGPTLPGGPNMDFCTLPVSAGLSSRPVLKPQPTTSLGISQLLTHSGQSPSSSSRIPAPDLPLSSSPGGGLSGRNPVSKAVEGFGFFASTAVPPSCRSPTSDLAADFVFSSSPAILPSGYCPESMPVTISMRPSDSIAGSNLFDVPLGDDIGRDSIEVYTPPFSSSHGGRAMTRSRGRARMCFWFQEEILLLNF